MAWLHGLLLPSFASVVALDPSAGMVEQAKEAHVRPPASPFDRAKRKTCPSSKIILSICVVAGQAAHWFNYSEAWPELARVVKRGGTLSFWGYKDHVIVGQPQASSIYDRFVYGQTEPVPGVESLGRFWEQPGRDILRDSYGSVVPPETDWQNVVRIAWTPTASRETSAMHPKGLFGNARRSSLVKSRAM